jgi:hypothetical protein
MGIWLGRLSRLRLPRWPAHAWDPGSGHFSVAGKLLADVASPWSHPVERWHLTCAGRRPVRRPIKRHHIAAAYQRAPSITIECCNNVPTIFRLGNPASDDRHPDSNTSREIDPALTPFELPHIPEHCRSHHRLKRLSPCRLLQAIHFPPQLYIPAGFAKSYRQQTPIYPAP